MTDEAELIEESTDVINQADAPIRSLDEDRLGRRDFAEALAAEVIAAPVERGYVMGLTGPWGSGKTSILNMTVDALGKDALVVQFNPWMFSGTEALVAAFFGEIAKQLERRESTLKSIAGKLADYGHLLSPLASLVGAGSAVGSAADILGKLSARPSVFEEHEELRKLLQGLDQRLVVVVDDVDRLRPQEVLDIVRLVRLVGDFPNTLYLLAFDRVRVEECLGEGSLERGRAYLEKIVQVTHDVPAPRQPDVTSIFLAGLESIVKDAAMGPFDREDWQNIFAFVIRPLLVTPRSVRRLLGSLSMTLRLVGDEVAFADLIGIETVRVLCPEIFTAIVSVAEALSATGGGLGAAAAGYLHGEKPADSPIAPILRIDQELGKDVCRWLFPATRRYFENMNYGSEWESTWRVKRKVASAAVLRFYLERQLPEGVVPARTVDAAISYLTEPEKLEELFAPLTAAELMDLLERMNATLEDFPYVDGPVEDDPATTGLPVLLDLLPRLPEETGFMSFSGSMVLMRAALRLLRRIPSEDARVETIRLASARTRSLSARFVLIRIAGHREDIGSKLIPSDLAEELESELRAQVNAASAEEFAAETRAARLAAFLAETTDGRQHMQALVENDRILLSLFVSAIGQTSAQAMGSAAVTITKVLPWPSFVSYLGKDLLSRRTAEVMQAAVDGELTLNDAELEAVTLAADYATGNGPKSPYDHIMGIQGATEAGEGDGEGPPFEEV